MNINEKYVRVVRDIMDYGYEYDDARRKGVKRRELFGVTLTHDIQRQGFPLLSLRKLFTKGIFAELAWMLRGDTNIKFLIDRGVNIWTDDAYRFYSSGEENPLGKEDFIQHVKDEAFELHFPPVKFGDLGAIYGDQMRGVSSGRDQIANLVEAIKKNPNDSGLIVNHWNTNDLMDMALRPCHVMWQISHREGKLDLAFYMRSSDVVLGLPFNIAFYAGMLHVICRLTGYEPGVVTYFGVKVHIYNDHYNAAYEIMNRPVIHNPCILTLNERIKTIDDLDTLDYTDFTVDGYQPQPPLVNKTPLLV